MKAIKLNIKMLSYLAAFMMAFAFVACDDDDKIGSFETVSLDALITEAENLIATSEEGTSPGDFQPGSKAELQEVLTWVEWQIANAESQDEISNAASRLQKYIDKFKESTVSLAIPIFNKTNGSWIQISENIKPVLADNFTIEIESYFTGSEWIETMFSAGEGDNGSQFGFNLRIFGDRLDLVIGNGGWQESYYEGGQGVKIGEWVHYAVTKSGSVWKVYMNGVEVISEDNFPTETLFNPDAPFTLGETSWWGNRPWNGMLRDFRVWSEVKTADQLNASRDLQLEGTEAGLEVYFPLDADLGTNFMDNTGNYTAKFVGTGVSWAPDGIPPVIELVFTSIDAAIADVEALKESVVEGETDGDFPMGTIMYLQSLIDDAVALKGTAEKQDQLDASVESIKDQLKMVNKFLVADTDGIFIERENPDAVGLRITPNYTPQGNYTIEFEVNVKSLLGYGTGEFVNNGQYGIWVYGYNELTEENVLNSGGMRNFTRKTDDSGWETGPTAPALTIKSNTWQHVAVTHDENVGGFPITIMYVDGVETGRDTIGVPAISGWGETWLGNGWGKMDGYIRDFRIWDEARAELNADISGNEANLKMYFPLDRVKGVVFKDVTGNFDAEMRGIEWNEIED